MDEKYKVVIRYKFHRHFCQQDLEESFEFDSLTEAIAKFNEALYEGIGIDYIKLYWGNTEIQCYEFD